MIFPDISALRTWAGVFSSCKTDADTAGRKRRKALDKMWRGELLRASRLDPGVAELRPPLSAVELKCHENGCMRNASGQCVSSRTGVPIRSLPRRALKRASVSES